MRSEVGVLVKWVFLLTVRGGIESTRWSRHDGRSVGQPGSEQVSLAYKEQEVGTHPWGHFLQYSFAS